MAIPSSFASTPVGERLGEILDEFRTVGQMSVGLGAPVRPDLSGMDLTTMVGTRTNALLNESIRAGDGVGGKAMLTGRPESVNSYVAAQGITHAHDKHVRIEGLETVAALPVMVDRVPRLVLYVADHRPVALGERWFGRFVPLVRRIAHDIAIEDEVRRRLERLRTPDEVAGGRLTRSDLLDIAQELAELAGAIDDLDLRARVERVRDRVTNGRSPAARAAAAGGLARREVEVLELVALGCNNRRVAENLGLSEGTVKSYLKNAMRKLNASNRVHAVRLARESGLVA